jgi:death-on-curing protein
LPRSKPAARLTSAYLEFLHDKGVAIRFKNTEPVAAYDCLDLNLLESAAEQPFQAGWGEEFYPSIYDKAACLFFSIAGGHIFRNGNKRTAVLAIDQFLMANGIYLLMSNPDMEKLAERTASYRERNENHQAVMREIAAIARDNSFEFRAIRKSHPKQYRRFHQTKNAIRAFHLNQPGIRPLQAAIQQR